jgi:hypothetical protein
MKADKVLLYVSGALAIISVLFALTVVFTPGSLNKLGLTGFATAGENTTGKINLTITSSVLINFTVDTIEWGSGRLETGNNVTLDTSKHLQPDLGNGANKSIGGNFTGAWGSRTNGLYLSNIGNVNVSINLKTGQNASEMIGGVEITPLYQLNITNNLTGSCIPNAGIDLGTYYDVNDEDPGTRFCNNLSNSPTMNQIRIDILLSIPRDSKVGYMEDNITAQAIQSAK